MSEPGNHRNRQADTRRPGGRSRKAGRRTTGASAPVSPKTGLPARRAAAAILRRVVRERQPLDPLLDPQSGHAAFCALDARDRRLVRAMLGAALRRYGTIGRRIAECLNGPLKDKSGRIAAILHIAAAQILFLDTPNRAAVDLAVADARIHPRTRHAAGLVNAVLRRLAADTNRPATDTGGDEEDDPMADTPDWLARRWIAAFGLATAAAIADAHRKAPPLDITARTDPERVARQIGGVVLPTGSVRIRAAGDIAGLPGYETGDWWVQDAAAALPVRLLGQVAGKLVADLCAAPGGKTAQLSAAGARVTAVEAVASRAARLTENLARLNLPATTVTADIRTWRPAAVFDAILLDAPCTATGTVRRHPDIPWLKSENDIAAMATLQQTMLRHAAALLRPGGVLVYCTCSLEPEEGGDRIAAFLHAHPDFARDPVRAGEIGGFRTWIDADGDLRTLPHYGFSPAADELGMDGFFAARLRRQ